MLYIQKNITKLTLIGVCLALLFSIATLGYAQEKISLDSPDYWCGAKWPPAVGESRTFGIDVNGDVCVKISTGIETVEVEKIVEVLVEATSNTGISVTLTKDKNGDPIMTASCPMVVATNQYDAKIECIKAGRKMKLYKRNNQIYSICEEK